MSKIKRHHILYVSIILFLIISTMVIAHFGWDLKLQSKFYRADSSEVWYQKHYSAWQWAYHYGPYPAIILILIALVVLALSWIQPRLKKFRKHCLLILLTVILGPGLLINVALKDHWGRPRPRNVEQFGGRWEFHEVWQPGTPGKGKSFPCGHCSMGFFFIVLYYSFKRKNKVVAYSFLAFSFIFGVFIGFARIAQGGHFLSDMIWAGGLTYLIAAMLYYSILKIPEEEANTELTTIKASPTTVKPIKIILVGAVLFLSIGILIFFLLFSKPIYKEYFHHVKQNADTNYLNIRFGIDRGDVSVHTGRFENPLRIETKLQGFGFPKYKFYSHLDNLRKNDTTFVDYQLNTQGLFFELDVSVAIFIDSLMLGNLTGHTLDGDIFLDQHLNHLTIDANALQTPKGKIERRE